VKFNKIIIVKGESMNRGEIFVCSGNMENIIKNKVARRSRNNRFINTRNLHTCTISHMYLVIVNVPVMHGELVELAIDMIRGVFSHCRCTGHTW
jgi:hypothetical protein